MNKEDILKRSREENRNGDEYVRMKKETASSHSYLVATTCLALLAISCYFGITNGRIALNGFEFALSDVLWVIMFLVNVVECSSKYTYFKQRKYLYYALFWLCGLIGCLIVMFR